MILSHDLFVELDHYAAGCILNTPTTLEQLKTQRIAIRDVEWSEIHTMVKGGYIPSSKYRGFDGYKVSSSGDIIGEAKTTNIFIEPDLLQISDKSIFRSKIKPHQKCVDRAPEFLVLLRGKLIRIAEIKI